MDKKYSAFYFEIVGFCNAKCPYCVTGNKSLKQAGHPSKCIEVNDFQKAIDRLLDIGLMYPGDAVSLFNWGEPTLHPKLNEILKVLKNRDLNFSISTNASKIFHFDDAILSNLQMLMFSVSGFSQSSYDRIHGFKFESILNNIRTYCKNVRKKGSTTKLSMAYHIYQFNIGEIHSARNFCRENGIDFLPYMAFLSDYYMMKSYLDQSASSELMTKIAKDLFLFYVDDLLAKMPKDYICPQYSILAIDEYCNVLTCCGLPKGHPEYSLGKLSALSADEIRKGKLSQKTCAGCIKSGQAYWGHNPFVPSYIYDLAGAAGNKSARLQNRDYVIQVLLNSKIYTLGRAFAWQVMYLLGDLKTFGSRLKRRIRAS